MSCRNRGGGLPESFLSGMQKQQTKTLVGLARCPHWGPARRNTASSNGHWGSGGTMGTRLDTKYPRMLKLGPKRSNSDRHFPQKREKRLNILPERKLCSWGPHRRGDRRRILPGSELGKWGRRWRSSGASPPPPPHQSPPRGSHPPLLEAQHSEPDILGVLPLPGNGSTGRMAPPDIGRSRNFPLELMLTMTSPCTGRNLGLGIISDLK